jgi:DNA-binding transcriptional ArsR family regulator
LGEIAAIARRQVGKRQSVVRRDVENDAEAVLPADVPVRMPDLPYRRDITTLEQVKAINDPTRSRILGIIQNQPATAKQIAQALNIPPGTVGYHLQVLESAGLAQVVARRLIRGIVATYYTRTARIFQYDLPPEVAGQFSATMDIMIHLRDELGDALADYGEGLSGREGFPHARLSAERAAYYQGKMDELMEEMIQETPDPSGDVYGFFGAFFCSPRYMQQVDPAGSEDDANLPNSHPDALPERHDA